MLNVSSSWAFINDVVTMLSLESLVVDDIFTSVIRDKDVDVNDPDFVRFSVLVTGKFHDQFTLNAEQRKVVQEHVQKKTLSLGNLFGNFEDLFQPTLWNAEGGPMRLRRAQPAPPHEAGDVTPEVKEVRPSPIRSVLDAVAAAMGKPDSAPASTSLHSHLCVQTCGRFVPVVATRGASYFPAVSK